VVLVGGRDFAMVVAQNSNADQEAGLGGKGKGGCGAGHIVEEVGEIKSKMDGSLRELKEKEYFGEREFGEREKREKGKQVWESQEQ